MEITKEKYKEILEIQMIPYNENSRWFEETLAKINQALQLQQGGVSGSYSKEELISAAKYGYEFHKTTSFPKQTFEQCCKNNFLQHLSMYNIVNNGRNITKCVVCGKRYHNPNNDSDTCYECREPHCK